MQKNYEATAARGGIPADAPAKRMALITGVVGLENVRDADLVIEAVFETMAVKKEVFEKLDQYAKPRSGCVPFVPESNFHKRLPVAASKAKTFCVGVIP